MSDSTRHPVIIFPGIAGSRLNTKNAWGNKSPLWFNTFQMFDLTNLSSTNISSTQENDISSTQEEDLTVSRAIVASYKTEADISNDSSLTPVESWQKHMRLQADGKTPEIEGDGNDQFNREEEGLKGIKNVSNPRDILPGVPGQPNQKNQYFQALVEKLVEIGYQEDVNLIGHPYDWRVAPGGLQQRYQTFTNLKTKIEELYTTYQLPLVLIAHSMGNRVVQYFLKWVEVNESKAWIDEHIERYIAISPPWIGAPQAIYRLSDSAIVLPAGKEQIALEGMKDVLQSFSSIPWLLPLTEDQYKYFNTQSFGYCSSSASQDLADYQPITVKETLEKAQAQNTTLKHQTTFYQDDALISENSGTIGSELVKCPPVNKLDVIYSTGFNTPVGAYYQDTDSKLKIVTELSQNNPTPTHKPGLVITQGVILETPATEQQIEVEFSDGTRLQNSGDVVVPYGSLTYFKKWQKEEPDRYIQGHEFSGDEKLNHNAIVAQPQVIDRIIELLSKSSAGV